MLTRARLVAGTALVVLAVALTVPAAQAAAVPRVSGLAAAGSSTTTAKLGVKWRKVTGATYQVRWAPSTARLASATRYTSRIASATSPALSNICITWYAQVRAKKGTRYGAWSAPKALKFSIPTVHVPTPITSGQTSTTQAQVRWARAAGAQSYRLDWSPAPFGNWPGLAHVYTPWTTSSATGTALHLPAAGAKDHFIAPGYGNPIFAQLDVRRCSGSIIHSPYFPVYPKASDPGSAATGDALRFGSYNVELTPSKAANPERITDLADNIATSGADVVALQEASATTATDLVAELASSQGETDWEACGRGQQQVLYRTSKWTSVSCDNVGADTDDGTAATPLPTPAVHLTPAQADPARQDIIVASVHLEDRKKFDSTATIPQQKQDAHDAATALIANIDSLEDALPASVPVLAAGDFKGNFGGGGQPAGAGYCDESSTPTCVGEGQPTFVRAGFLDARGAVTRVGAEYASVNGHLGTQVPMNSGVGSRADFILARGFTGVSRYVIRYNVMYDNLPLRPGNLSAGGTPTDHDLLYADLFVPHKS
ncbi:MAG: endonuclease/exonuclease/phosphatase family protein [Marmoricola sp.]